MKQYLLKIIILSVFIFSTVSSGTMAHEGHNDAFSQDAVDATQIQKIEITPEGEKAIGIKTTPITTSTLHQFIQTTGQVEAADNHSFDLSAPIAGQVRKALVKEGDTVRQGQTLALIQSIEAANLLKDLLNQKASLERDITVFSNQVHVEKANYEREKALLAEGITSQKDYLAAESAYQSAKASLTAVKKQLQTTLSSTKSQLAVMGISNKTVENALASGQVTPNVSIVSPINGVVSFRDITPGETVQSNKTVFSVVNVSPVWVVVDVFQENIPRIKPGLAVRVKASSGHIIEGKVTSIGATVDPKKRTLPVRIVSQNINGELRPGMTVTAEILYGEAKEGAIVIPNSAVVEEQGQSVTYVKYDTYYQPVRIQTGLKTASDIEILDGLYEGDELVVRGADQLRAHALLSGKGDLEDEASDHSEQSKSGAFPDAFLWGILAGGLGIGVIALLFFFLAYNKNPGRTR